ncbi:MAG: hypothetical protein LBU80_01585, partial [Rikenellaceae bacterium]|nr:hypothetical protein [Rikenellaceae bacterium]
MKRNIILAFLLLLLCSCSWENELAPDGATPAPITTRGYIEVQVADEHTDEDDVELSDDIKTIRFFVFTDLDSYPRKEVGTPKTVITEANRASVLKAVFEVSRTEHGPNNKLVVAIANEPDAMTVDLDAVTTPRELEDLDLILSDFLSNDHLSLQSDTPMPMTGAVWTDRDDVHATPGAALAAADRVGLLLERAVARVDVYLTTEITGGVNLLPNSSITLKNTCTESPFVRHEIGDRVLGKIQTVPSAGFAGNDKAWTPAPGQKNIPADASIYVCSFYTPERYCRADKLTLDIALATDDGEKGATVTLDKLYDGKGVRHDIDTVRRNNRYIVRGNIRKAQNVTADVGIVVLPWNEGLEAFPLGQYRLTVDRSSLVFPSAGGTQTVAVTADHPDPWRIEKTENL